MNGNTRKYISISDDFRTKIKSGFYTPGDLLPNYHILSKQLNCSHPTLQKAFGVLESEGYVNMIHGSGIFVSKGLVSTEVHPSFDIENLTIIGIANVLTPETHSIKSMENQIINEILMANSGTVKYEPMQISYIDCQDLQSRLGYYRNILDGLIIMSSSYNPLASNVQYALKQHIPVVFSSLSVPSQLPHIPVDVVSHDEYHGGYEVGRYFIERGHRDIGLIGDIRTHSKLGRLPGFTAALKESGLKAIIAEFEQKELEQYAGMTQFLKIGSICVQKLLKKRNLPTAIMCMNDITAIGAFNEFNRAGVSMPDEVELFGFADDIESQLYFSDRINPVSTVQFSIDMMAKESFRLLEQRLKNPDIPRQIATIPATIIHRETTKGESVYGSKSGMNSGHGRENHNINK